MSDLHEILLWLSQSVGLFYLLAMAAGVLIYALWPSNKKVFSHAANSILRDEDRP